MAGGAIATHYLKNVHNIQIVAFVSSVGPIGMEFSDNEKLMQFLNSVTSEEVDKNEVRCPCPHFASRMKDVMH